MLLRKWATDFYSYKFDMIYNNNTNWRVNSAKGVINIR